MMAEGVAENRVVCGAKTILCVDDEPNVLSAIRRAFRHDKHRLLFAANALEALGIMASEPVHVVISDFRMPEVDGIELLKEIHRLYPTTVRTILTGYADLRLIQQAFERGDIYRFITKPWDDGELHVTVRQCLVQHELERLNGKKEIL